jgi:hypothetical protein
MTVTGSPRSAAGHKALKEQGRPTRSQHQYQRHTNAPPFVREAEVLVKGILAIVAARDQ